MVVIIVILKIEPGKESVNLYLLFYDLISLLRYICLFVVT